MDEVGYLLVANMVRSWAPDCVITTGDNNYSVGAASTIDATAEASLGLVGPCSYTRLPGRRSRCNGASARDIRQIR